MAAVARASGGGVMAVVETELEERGMAAAERELEERGMAAVEKVTEVAATAGVAKVLVAEVKAVGEAASAALQKSKWWTGC